MSGLLQGKATIVTGAAGGIGSEVSEQFAREGARVLATDINGEGVAEVVRKINQAGGQAIAMTVDTTKEDQVKAMVDQAISAFGRLDCAFNNVGIAVTSSRLIDVTLEEFERGLDVNVIGTWLCMKHEIPRMIEGGGGSVVNMASLSGVLGVPRMGVYSTSKHAVNGLTKSAAAEYGISKVRVNSICPASVATAQMRAMIASGAIGSGRGANPNAMNGRPGDTTEIGELAMWLLSDRSSYVTGQAINIDGGQTAGVFFLTEAAG